jgi:hypothetical protein
MRVAKMKDVKADGVLMVPLVMSAYSRLLAQLAAQGQKLFEPGGIDQIVKYNLMEFETMLREDFASARDAVLMERDKASKQ